MKSEAERLAIQWGLPVAIMLVAVVVRLLLHGQADDDRPHSRVSHWSVRRCHG